MGAPVPRKCRRAAAFALAGVTGLFGVLLAGSPAAAADPLVGSDPVNGARIDQPPAAVRLTFRSTLDPSTTKLDITGPDNVKAAAGAPRFDGPNAEVDFLPGRAGLYIVTYTVTDGGQPARGEVRFTLTTGAPPPPTVAPSVGATVSAAPGVTSGPTGPGIGASTAPGTSAPVASGGTDDGAPRWPWIVLAVGVVAALAGGAYALRRRRAGG
jgi:methionine-rich copper-binding protein CopC